MSLRKAWQRPEVGLLLALGALAACVLAELVSILKLNGGHFTYTLDDPYIHLALAQRIHGGQYGINPGEPSAPSSSILWPFLMAPVAGTRFVGYLPLLIGIAAAAATMFLFYKMVVELLFAGSSSPNPFLVSVFVFLLALATNLIGLAFSGMEHSLQVFLAGLAALGLIREAGNGRIPLFLPLAIVLGPLIRYESLAISVAATAYLFARGHRRAAIVALVATLIPLALFSAFLAHLGLGIAPTSVLLKAPILDPERKAGLLSGLRTTLRDPTGVLLALSGIWMLSLALFSTRPAQEKTFAASAALATSLHAVAGSYGAYHRWEPYIVAFVLLALLYLERRPISDAVARWPAPLMAAVAALWCVAVGSRYIFGLTTIPIAANNIYEQQYQMHRYAADFERGGVAVNDVGYVSFGNRNYVLDVLGLGSPGPPAGEDSLSTWVSGPVARHGIETAMIYDEWFADHPRAWRRVGVLRLSRPKITPAWESVSFYATSEEAYPRVRRRVAAFQATLPPRVRFEFTE
jgi:hypothetical protein